MIPLLEDLIKYVYDKVIGIIDTYEEYINI
jgi:hypothetical protein